MKKSKLSITLMAALLSVGTLAGCDDVKPSNDSVIVSYKINGKSGTITADDILVKYYQDSNKYESIFNAIKSVVIKNYFEVNEEVTIPGNNQKKNVGLADVDKLKTDANGKVASDKITAETAAHTNKTTYKEEMDKIFKANNVDNEDQLFNKYLNELKEEKFVQNYNEYHMDELRDGYSRPTETSKQLTNEVETKLEGMWTGYLDDMLPYHVSHILVNVEDSSETNYYNGTISKDNCKKLYDVVNSLSTGTNNFNMLAKTYSDDTGSKVDHGALGIMDYSTEYINEFKLGIYAYEQFFGKNAGGSVKNRIAIPTDAINGGKLDELFTKAFNGTDETTAKVPEIDIGFFSDLFEIREQEKSKTTVKGIEFTYDVMGGSASMFPRNIMYNEVLNKHSFAFITTQEDVGTTELAEGITGFHKFANANASGTDNVANVLNGKKILSVKVGGEYRPILVVRGGTSEYQGIHFIVVNKDPFGDKADLSKYYSTVKPTESEFITTSKGTTYVNYNVENDNAKYTERITNLESKFKSNNSDKHNKFVVRRYMEKLGLKIDNPLLEEELFRWIDNTIEVSKTKESEDRVSKWKGYLTTLTNQNKGRKKLVSRLARIGFDMPVNTTEISKVAASGKIGYEGNKDGHEWSGTTVKTKMNDVKTKEGLLATAIINGEQNAIEAAQTALDTAKTELNTLITANIENYCAYVGLTEEQCYALYDDFMKVFEIKAAVKPSETKVYLSDLYNLKGAIFNDGQTH